MLRPADVNGIRGAMILSNLYCLRMGVKSGGHGPNEGARVLNGITLDLTLMNKVVRVAHVQSIRALAPTVCC